MKRSLASIITLSMTLAMPVGAMAATGTEKDTSEESAALEEVQNSLPMMDMGGGGYYPGPMGGVTVDVSVTQEVKPDYIGLSAYCEVSEVASRQEVRTTLNKIFTEIKNGVGSDGKVRKQGVPGVYPFYRMDGTVSDKFSGSLGIMIRITNLSAIQRIMDLVESKDCNVSWDVRLNDTQDHELTVVDQLLARLEKRKKVYEKLLGKRLTTVVGVSLSTWADGYSTYEPETNTVDAVTNLSVTFELDSRTTLPTSTPRG